MNITKELTKAVAYGIGVMCGKHNLNLTKDYIKKVSLEYAQQQVKNLNKHDVINQVCLNPKYAKETVCVKFNDDGSCSPCGFCKQTCL